MGVTRGPKYPGIEDGLVFLIDPKNRDFWSGGTATNEIINNIAGVITNTSTVIEVDGSLTTQGYFESDGTDDYITTEFDLTNHCIGRNTGCPNSGNFTMNAWVLFDSITVEQHFFGRHYGNGRFYFGIDNTGAVYHLGVGDDYSIFGGSIDGSPAIAHGISAGTWANVTVTFDNSDPTAAQGGTVNVYTNAVFKGTFGASWTQTSTIDPILMGRNNNGTDDSFLDGKLGPVMVYNRVLSTAEISTNYN